MKVFYLVFLGMSYPKFWGFLPFNACLFCANSTFSISKVYMTVFYGNLVLNCADKLSVHVSQQKTITQK